MREKQNFFKQLLRALCGPIQTEDHYSNGKRKFLNTYKGGRLVKKETWHEGGAQQKLERYFEDASFIIKEFYKDGSIKSEKTRDAENNVYSKEWYKRGQLKSKKFVVNKELIFYQSFYKSGITKRYYERNTRDGFYSRFYEKNEQGEPLREVVAEHEDYLIRKTYFREYVIIQYFEKGNQIHSEKICRDSIPRLIGLS